jgi:hypothetical protein
MRLHNEYNQSSHGPIDAWARLVLPGDDLPETTRAINNLMHMPWHLSRNTLYESLMNAADMAAKHFDKGLCPTSTRRKYLARYAMFEQSIENEDGSLFFIRDNKNFYGYTRVLPITNGQWNRYFNERKITEADFSACTPDLLELGGASIYIQAIVFPHFALTDKHDKRVLQEAGFAGLLGSFLPETLPSNGLNVYFTAFHPYTDNLADRLGIKQIGENSHGYKIYGFNIAEDSPNYSLGGAILRRRAEGKTPFKRFKRQPAEQYKLQPPSPTLAISHDANTEPN